MTGYGVNDVLALKDADLGIAMGSGSSAARSVAQLVLLDSTFDALPNVVAEGRRVLGNIERTSNLYVTKTVYAMLRRQDWMREYLIEQGQPPLRFVGEASPDDPAPHVAARMREELGIGAAWAGQHATWTGALAALIDLVEHAGILVVSNGVVGNNTHRTLDSEEFRGFVLTDDYAPLVFINTVDGKAAQMFTLAHELAHVWLAQSAAFDLREMQPAGVPIEQTCNRVAAEFLVPEAEMLAAWPAARGELRSFDELARRFKVSALVVARRALDLRLIDREGFVVFYADYRDDTRRQAAAKPSGGNFWATQENRIGRRFGEAVVHATQEGRLLYRDAFVLTDLHGDTFARYAARVEASDTA
ncbi:MAG: ImmA/IrrE family metallo-endopeptidase [Actinobacteria bacterium]|nr:ImmA/IrrE family metallo-endopeptidase [Actinomycetota bacterium]